VPEEGKRCNGWRCSNLRRRRVRVFLFGGTWEMKNEK